MDNNIITAISAVGFPIVACLLMGYVYFRTLSEIRLIIEELKGIIQRNTDAIDDLRDIIIKEDKTNGIS